jgi:hypothetical protein
MPRAVAENVAGSIGAVVMAVYKTVPGAVEGMLHSARRRDDESRPSTGAYTVTSIGQSMALGATIGTAAGPFGAAVGTGAGFLFAVLGRVAESKSKAAREFVATVDYRVDEANDGSRPVLQRAVDGLCVGSQTGFQEGLSRGWDAGVSLIDATEGAILNLKDTLFGH